MRTWRRAVKAAVLSAKEGRVITPQELQDRIDNERAGEAANWLDEQVKKSPMGVWFPQDQTGPSWVPSFFRWGKGDE